MKMIPSPADPGAASVSRAAFPMVALGASAGGLEALEQFFEQVPLNTGMAFIVVQHLDPAHEGMMPELLERSTWMKVVQIKDRTTVEPNCVYIIPPKQDLSILHGVLHLLNPTATRGLWLPIDFFFHALALDQREFSIGVILSGMGSDGTLGLRAIKQNCGLAVVQEPRTAKFDCMPRSAIEAGMVDIVAPAAELFGKILAYANGVDRHSDEAPAMQIKDQSALEKVIVLLRAHTRNDFSLYKRNTLYRRIERRMGMHQITKMESYVRFLHENSQELDLLFNELLIGVTNFFRDCAVWEELRTKFIPELLATRVPGQFLRAWVPGCSSGEEAYSLAMIFKEAVEDLKPRANFSLQIFATDLDRDSIDKARLGFFAASSMADLSAERQARFFSKENSGYRVRREIREMVIFAPQNIIMDPPFTKLDFLSCRNLLIYLTAEVQKKLMPLFHFCLAPGGLLLLGSAETIGSSTDLFATVSAKSRLFRRIEPLQKQEPVEFPSSFAVFRSTMANASQVSKSSASLQSQADQLVLQDYAPPAVLTNLKGDIFYISGHTGKYLEPAAGKANWNLFAMAREGLRYELTKAFERVLNQREAVILNNLNVITHGGLQHVEVSLQKLDKAGQLHDLIMIVFKDVITPRKAKASHASRSIRPLEDSELEIMQVRNEARSTHEKMQISQEEIRSANEELQSTNEELQSTNEELTTSKEEMQSLNEELQTVNAELQAKVDELSRASNDMKNLLDSTDIATLFLDCDLHVRRFTQQMTKIIKLIPSDVGRPITDLGSNLDDPNLAADVRDVLRTLVSAEKSVSAFDGRWFTMRIMPYRTMDERIDGVVITFSDITVAKTLEVKLRNQHANLEADAVHHQVVPAKLRRNVGGNRQA